MTTTYRYSVEILHLLVSSDHAYFGRANDGAASVPTSDLDRVEVVAGKGIVGDRFFGKAAHMDAAITLMAVESLEAIATELDVPPLDPLLTRRNVVLRGAHLTPLIGEEFALESHGEIVQLRGGRHAHPCVWMDRMLAPGAHAAMRGRGGLRCQPLSNGILHRGLYTAIRDQHMLEPTQTLLTPGHTTSMELPAPPLPNLNETMTPKFGSSSIFWKETTSPGGCVSALIC